MGTLFTLLFEVGPWVALFVIIRYGPIPNPFRKRELPIGVALLVGAITFALGFFGPMILTPGANQGPMLGIFITGPLGFVVGMAWGSARAARAR